MKTSTLKTAMHIVMVCALIVTTVVLTKNIVNDIKYLYGLEATGSGTICFFDMLQ